MATMQYRTRRSPDLGAMRWQPYSGIRGATTHRRGGAAPTHLSNAIAASETWKRSRLAPLPAGFTPR